MQAKKAGKQFLELGACLTAKLLDIGFGFWTHSKP